MTYKELLKKLNQLTPEQLEQEVEVFACDKEFTFGDEYFLIDDLLTGNNLGYTMDSTEVYLVYSK